MEVQLVCRACARQEYSAESTIIVVAPAACQWCDDRRWREEHRAAAARRAREVALRDSVFPPQAVDEE